MGSSLAQVNRKHRRNLTTKGTGRKRSDYKNKSLGPRVKAVQAELGTGHGGTSSTAGLEFMVGQVEEFEFARITMNANQASGMRTNPDGDMIAYVVAGGITVSIQGRGNTVLPEGNSVILKAGDSWSWSSGDTGALVFVARTADYEDDVEQLTDAVFGQSTTTYVDELSTQPGTYIPVASKRRPKSKEERKAIVDANAGKHRAVVRKRAAAEAVQAPPANKGVPAGTSPKEYCPMPIDPTSLEKVGQPTGVPLQSDVEDRLKSTAVKNAAAAKKVEIAARQNAGEV